MRPLFIDGLLKANPQARHLHHPVLVPAPVLAPLPQGERLFLSCLPSFRVLKGR